MTTPKNQGSSSQTSGAKPETKSPEAKMKSDIEKTAEEVKDAAEQRAEREKSAVRREVDHAAEAVRARAEEGYDEARSYAASSADDTASRIREAGDAFGPDSFAHTVADRLADNLSQAASAVRDTDLGSLQQDVTEFARRNPLVFFGGAALLGFFAARLMKASERAETDYPAPAQRPSSPGAYAQSPSQRSTHGYNPNANSPNANSVDRGTWGYS